MHPGAPGRAGAGRLGHRPPTASRCSWRWRRVAAESTDAWGGFLADLTARGLRAPLLVISDGAAGLIGAVELVLPAQPAPAVSDPPSPQRAGQGARPRPGRGQGGLLGASSTPTTRAPSPGDGAVAAVQAAHDRVRRAVRQRCYPSAVALPASTDLAALTTYLRFPAEHHRRIRHSNFIERTFGETRRRTKVIGRLPGETHLPVAGVGGARPGQPRLARPHHDPAGRCACCRTCAASSSTHLPRSDHRSTTIRATTRQSELSPNMHSTRKPRPSIYTAPGTPPFLRRECPSCERQFKWFHGHTADRPDHCLDPLLYTCPYCGEAAGHDSWWTKEQLEFAQDAAAGPAIDAMADELARAFRRTPGIRFEPSRKHRPDPPMPLLEPDDMTMVALPATDLSR